MVDKVGLHEFAGKGNYKDWLFIYDPTQDRGGLIKGPYDPNAFKGMGGGPGTSLNPSGGNGLPEPPRPQQSGRTNGWTARNTDATTAHAKSVKIRREEAPPKDQAPSYDEA
jgi:hypothetical protein